jgi:hypothetical protein
MTRADHAKGWGYCGKWEAQSRPPLLSDKWIHAVVLNNHTEVAHFDTLAEAQLDAAKRNYAMGSYHLPPLLGL